MRSCHAQPRKAMLQATQILKAESLQESSPGLKWRSHANPGHLTSSKRRSEGAQETRKHLPALFQSATIATPGSRSLGWPPKGLSGLWIHRYFDQQINSTSKCNFACEATSEPVGLTTQARQYPEPFAAWHVKHQLWHEQMLPELR